MCVRVCSAHDILAWQHSYSHNNKSPGNDKRHFSDIKVPYTSRICSHATKFCAIDFIQNDDGDDDDDLITWHFSQMEHYHFEWMDMDMQMKRHNNQQRRRRNSKMHFHTLAYVENIQFIYVFSFVQCVSRC